MLAPGDGLSEWMRARFILKLGTASSPSGLREKDGFEGHARDDLTILAHEEENVFLFVPSPQNTPTTLSEMDGLDKRHSPDRHK